MKNHFGCVFIVNFGVICSTNGSWKNILFGLRFADFYPVFGLISHWLGKFCANSAMLKRLKRTLQDTKSSRLSGSSRRLRPPILPVSRRPRLSVRPTPLLWMEWQRKQTKLNLSSLFSRPSPLAPSPVTSAPSLSQCVPSIQI
jgi:hypothetical protein